MTLFEQLKADQLTARKAKETLKATLLTTLLGEAGMKGKNARNGDPTDDEVKDTIKAFLKNARLTLEKLGPIEGGPVMAVNAEIQILTSYLPTQMTEEQLRYTISTGIQAGRWEKSLKAKGLVMKYLKENFAGQYDGADASKAFDYVMQG